MLKAAIEDGVVHSPYPSIEIPVRCFYDLAREKLSTNPDKTALVDTTMSLTRAAVLTRMQRYAVGFRQHGLLAGDRVCVHVKNSAENLIAMCGCVLAGATIVLAKTSLTEDELRYQALDSDSRHILTDEELTAKTSKAVANLGMKGLFCMGHAAGYVSASTFSHLDEQLFEESPVTDPRNAVLAVCYTSGTTGLPKGAEVTHYSYVCSFYITRRKTSENDHCFDFPVAYFLVDFRQLRDTFMLFNQAWKLTQTTFVVRLHMPWGEKDVLLWQGPITHQSGLLYPILGLLDGVTCAITTATLSPLEIMDAIDKYKATAALFFPAQLQALVREMQRAGRGLPSMRGIAVGGSVLPPSVAQAARKAFVGIEMLLNVYGMTESCGVILGQPKTTKANTENDVGVPVTMVEAKVVDAATGQKLGPHQTGEVCYRSASMMKNYYKRPRETADLFDEEGWCKTGDFGYYDDTGRFYILDRLKQMIKCMGRQVIPSQIEELLLRKHGSEIAEVSVVGVPHAEVGEAPAAAVVLTEEVSRRDRKLLAEDIKATVKRTLPAHKHLYGGVFFVESLPKTETAKVNRPALARTLAGVDEVVPK